MMRGMSRCALVVAGVLMASTSWAQMVVDPELPDYTPSEGVSGSIKSVGSDTMNNMMTLWAEEFRKFYPNVSVSIEGKGSSTAPPALIAGTANFGPMSRPMKDKESDEFEAKYGYKPTALPGAIDMIAVYVHKDNPIKGLTLPQVDAIFSSTRSLGYPQDVTRWGELGIEGDWANAPIGLYGRNAASGTYGYFKEHALGKGDFKSSVKEQPGSSSVVQGVATDRFAIGYSGIGYMTADVRAVPLSQDEGVAFVEATAANAYSGDYPLARFLYVMINHKPQTELDPLRREFVRYIYSKQGQQAVVRVGDLPVSAAVARQALQSIGIEPGF